MIVVIPTNREVNLDYLTPLIEADARFIVVDDSEGAISLTHPQFEVYNWDDRRRMLGPLDVGFPKRNGACRDFGFFVAWSTSEPGEIVVALDDDCNVEDPMFPSRVEAVLSDAPRPVASCDGPHLNILELYAGIPQDLYPRGFPYSARVAHDPIVLKRAISRPVTFGLGLWRGVFDVNAIDKISGPAYTHPDAALREESVLVDDAKLVSVCSMNMYFRREVIPAVYQLPMHVSVAPGWVVDRYGDIWGGFILKTLMDLRGEAMAVGNPMITHAKEGTFERNIWQEHVAHIVNDEFIELLGTAAADIVVGDYLAMLSQICDAFGRATHTASPLLREYLVQLVPAMEAWTTSLAK